MDKKGSNKYKTMKTPIILLFIILLSSCSNDTGKHNDSFPYLILESYSLDDGPYIFCCFDKNDKFMEVDNSLYYNYNEISFMSYSDNSPKRIVEGKLYKDLLSFLHGKDGYTYSFIENTIESITIYSDSIFCGISRGESLNKFFTIEGDFVRVVNGKYELYNGADILDANNSINNVLFPEQFKLKLIEELNVEKNTYQFYLHLKYDNKFVDIKIVRINLSE